MTARFWSLRKCFTQHGQKVHNASQHRGIRRKDQFGCYTYSEKCLGCLYWGIVRRRLGTGLYGPSPPVRSPGWDEIERHSRYSMWSERIAVIRGTMLGTRVRKTARGFSGMYSCGRCSEEWGSDRHNILALNIDNNPRNHERLMKKFMLKSWSPHNHKFRRGRWPFQALP